MEKDANLSTNKESQSAKSEASPKTDKKAATVMTSTVNLMKTILGTGVLALPAGVAAVSDMPIS